jgi:YidC/Oxa1 family membrane protein insertase
MDIRRIILYAALAFTSYSLITAWHTDYPAVNTVSALTTSTKSQLSTDGHLLPQLKTDSVQAAQESLGNVLNSKPKLVSTTPKLVQVKTDVLDIVIDLKQGDIINSKLLDYPASVSEKTTPFTLLNDKHDERYVANSSLVVPSGNTLQSMDMNFTVPQEKYELTLTSSPLIVTLTSNNPEGLEVSKIYTFTRESYLIDVKYIIVNKGSTPWKGYLNTQLLRSSPKEDSSSIFHVGSFTGASYSNPGKNNYKKITFPQMTKENLEINTTGGWVAMQQHYFLNAWIPDQSSANMLYTRAANEDFTIGAISQPITVATQEQKTLHTQLYTGPEIAEVLKNIAPALDQTIDYGWLWFLSSLLFSVMKAIYKVVGNWGWSIILVTVLIKLAFYKLSATSYRSMAGMRKLQPKLQALKERYGDDKAKMSQATMELYKQEKLNPLGGCLPILVQIPVFIALYWVLLESVELRQAPFMLWINDLAAADPYHILPIIMGATMLIQQRLNPAPPDPVQAKVMMFLPILFTGLFWNFPAGLVLYWIVNNTLSILQQWYITAKYEEKSTPKKPALTSK